MSHHNFQIIQHLFYVHTLDFAYCSQELKTGLCIIALWFTAITLLISSFLSPLNASYTPPLFKIKLLWKTGISRDLSTCRPFFILFAIFAVYCMGIMYKRSRGTLHATAEETARQIRGLSYKVFIVTW